MARFIPPISGFEHADPAEPIDLADRETLFRRHLRYICWLGQRWWRWVDITDRAVAVEDLIQDISTAVLRSLNEFDPAKGSFRTWINLMARDAACQLRRGDRTIKRRRTRARLPRQVRDPRAGKPEYLGDVWDRVGELLDERERAVVELHFRDGLEFGEIAKRFGYSRGWSANLWASARKKLKEVEEGGKAAAV